VGRVAATLRAKRGGMRQGAVGRRRPAPRQVRGFSLLPATVIGPSMKQVEPMVDDYGFPASEPIKDARSETPALPSSRTSQRRLKGRSRTKPLDWPTWFPGNDKAQQAAQVIAHSLWLDRLLGLPMTTAEILSRWPYCDFKQPAVTTFLTRLGISSAEPPPSPTPN